MTSQPVIGVLALQGDFLEHRVGMEQLGYPVQEVRTVADAERTAGLIIPGGESTVIGKLLRQTKLGPWIQQRAKQGYPVYGTCAGCILIAKNVDSEYSLQLIDITAQRNAFGRQIDSFETQLIVGTKYSKQLGVKKFTGVFIRAPKIISTGPAVETLITYDKMPVLVREDNVLAGTFHPELSETAAIHAYFGRMVEAAVYGYQL